VVFRVLKEALEEPELPVLQVLMVPQALRVPQDLRVFKESLDPPVQLALEDTLAK
jgi:hypothetical protein